MSLHLIRAFVSSLLTLVRSGRAQSGSAITPHELQAILTHPAAPLVIDVRNADEFIGERGHIPGAVLCPLPEIDTKLSELRAHRTQPIITV
jgi:3-mercaptopyruvate sulfurtransferase SseA